MIFVFGECDFQKIKFAGQYKIGHKEFRTRERGNMVSVFYPMDDSAETRELLKTRNTPWLRHGEKTMQGIANSSVPYDSDQGLPLAVFR